ncbi:hypothetical protein ILYODFUR_037371 [Ilyodon furcidens]|uniref:Uncharacterized protein n=1 Tax=Ilyodon furcidens TaxID=33524 RepID=A0ABV0TI90_9TELE
MEDRWSDRGVKEAIYVVWCCSGRHAWMQWGRRRRALWLHWPSLPCIGLGWACLLGGSWWVVCVLGWWFTPCPYGCIEGCVVSLGVAKGFQCVWWRGCVTYQLLGLDWPDGYFGAELVGGSPWADVAVPVMLCVCVFVGA